MRARQYECYYYYNDNQYDKCELTKQQIEKYNENLINSRQYRLTNGMVKRVDDLVIYVNGKLMTADEFINQSKQRQTKRK